MRRGDHPNRICSRHRPTYELPPSQRTIAVELLKVLLREVMSVPGKQVGNDGMDDQELGNDQDHALSTWDAAPSSMSVSQRPIRLRTISRASGVNTDLVERGRQLGWSDVQVIDDDLGRSGDGIARPGFEKLLARHLRGPRRRRPVN